MIFEREFILNYAGFNYDLNQYEIESENGDETILSDLIDSLTPQCLEGRKIKITIEEGEE